MTEEEWMELEHLSGARNRVDPRDARARHKELLEKTREVDEHPDEYEGNCLCRLCMSYV